MKKINSLSSIAVLLLMLTSCEDKIIQEGVNTISGNINLEVCSGEQSFSGIDSISDIRGDSVLLNWTAPAASIGFSIFKKENAGALEFVETVNAGTSSYKVANLNELTDYTFLARSIDQNGQLDCNRKFSPATTTARQVFKSCLDIQTYYGGTEPTGVYEVDVDLAGPKPPFNVYCSMDFNGGGWTRIFVHKTVGGLFSSAVDAKEKNITDTSADLYSQLNKLDSFKRSGEFEFWLRYPGLDGNAGGNRWTQTSNPTSQNIQDYTAVSIDHSGHYWGGLERGNPSRTLTDGSVSHSNWFYAIGSFNYWPNAGKIPGPNSSGVTEVELYVR